MYRCGRCRREVEAVDYNFHQKYCKYCRRKAEYRWREKNPEVFKRIKKKHRTVKRDAAWCWDRTCQQCGKRFKNSKWTLIPTTEQGYAKGVRYEQDCATLTSNYMAVCKDCHLVYLENGNSWKI